LRYEDRRWISLGSRSLLLLLRLLLLVLLLLGTICTSGSSGDGNVFIRVVIGFSARIFCCSITICGSLSTGRGVRIPGFLDYMYAIVSVRLGSLPSEAGSRDEEHTAERLHLIGGCFGSHVEGRASR
jgi:hypothetical protein